jgi:outer membrane lipoprotein SlyB
MNAIQRSVPSKTALLAGVCALMVWSTAPALAQTSSPGAAARATATVCGDCGTITDIKQTKVKGKATWKGTVGGAVAGGVVGNQVGGGDGNKIATAAGAVGGAIAGREIEKRMNKKDVFEFSIRMENGSTTTVQKEVKGSWQVGDRVKVKGQDLIPR